MNWIVIWFVVVLVGMVVLIGKRLHRYVWRVGIQGCEAADVCIVDQAVRRVSLQFGVPIRSIRLEQDPRAQVDFVIMLVRGRPSEPSKRYYPIYCADLRNYGAVMSGEVIYSVLHRGIREATSLKQFRRAG